MKTWILSILMLCLGVQIASAQTPKASRFELNLGTTNGLSYELGLSQRWTARAELGLASGFSYNFSQFSYWGFVPTAGVEARWYHSKHKSERGGYISLGYDYQFASLTFLRPSNAFVNTLHTGTMHFTPGWGYRHRMNDKWSFNFFTGVGVSWKVYNYSGSVQVTPTNVFALTFDFGFSYRL